MDKLKVNYWTKLESGKIQCDLCPRGCQLSEGQRGLCFVRGREEDSMVLYTYGRSSGFCIDPIEKKPLNHFYPGSSILSFGTAGCNLSCRFCQNWDISKSRHVDRLQSLASPKEIVELARSNNVDSIAYTYNDPVIFLEYACDTSIIAQENGIKTVAVTAGYINEKPREEFFRNIDAANVDLKGFSEEFYRKQAGGHLQPVLETLKYLKYETNVWFEITTLLIPGLNDSQDELEKMCEWIAVNLGRDIPLHFTAFHPDYKVNNLPPTSLETLLKAYEIGQAAGLHHIYLGNVHSRKQASTYCSSCKKLLIERDWYSLGEWNLEHSNCRFCKTPLAGHFYETPGEFGRQRIPLGV